LKNIRGLLLGAIAFVLLYAGVVIASGLGWNPAGVQWTFESSGQFGDSFGPLGTIMSAIAAVSALMAYWSQREELERLKDAEETSNTRASKVDFERTFFQLITLFRDTLQMIEYHDYHSNKDYNGADAVARILYEGMGSAPDKPVEYVEKKFSEMYNRNQNKLGHYFRLFYHIVKFIDGSEIPNKMQYIRILRALLSRSEIAIIGLNCCYGGGQEKLKPLVERYAILHNISSSEANRFYLSNMMNSSAFGDREIGASGEVGA
jgi:hypothetical protein